MSNTKHTPGPWAVDTTASGKRYVLAPRNACIAKMLSDTAEDEANAHLIAASPDLLSALQNVLTDAGQEFLSVGLRTEIRATNA